MVPLTDRNHQKPPRRTSLKLQVYALNICKLRPFKNGKKSLVSLCHNENSQGATLQAASTFLSFFFKPIGSLSGIYFSLHFTYKKSTKCIRTKKKIYIYINTIIPMDPAWLKTVKRIHDLRMDPSLFSPPSTFMAS